jgi:hypothetical protein
MGHRQCNSVAPGGCINKRAARTSRCGSPAWAFHPGTKLLIGDIDSIVRVQPLLSRFHAQHDVETFGILRNRDLGRPLRRIARRGYGHRNDIRGLVKTIDDTIRTDRGRGAYMNVGGVLAGGGGLSCKLQAEVGALDLIYQGSFTRP